MYFHVLIGFRKIKEYFRVRKLERLFPSFKDVNRVFNQFYLGKNPYSLCHAFYREKHVNDPFVYGETPLSVIYAIAKHLNIGKQDVFLDLGCGSGRGLFFLNRITSCKTIGIEAVPAFVTLGNDIARSVHLDKEVIFIEKDLLKGNYPQANIVYLALTCMEDDLIVKIVSYLGQMPKNTIFISLSAPLTDYSINFQIIEIFEKEFLWGKTDVFIQRYQGKRADFL